MLSNTANDSPGSSLAAPKPKKNKKKNRKAKSNAAITNGETTVANRLKPEQEPEDEGEAEDDSRTNTEPPTPTSSRRHGDPNASVLSNGVNGNSHEGEQISNDGDAREGPEKPRQHSRARRSQSMQLPTREPDVRPPDSNEGERFEALSRERETLRQEVSQMRRSLEELQKKHDAEISSLQESLSRTQNERDEKSSQYQSLLGKVNTIRSQLGDRLKADAEDLAQARSRIEDLEEQNSSLREQDEAREAELAALAEQGEQQSKELSSLRNRALLSHENFRKERDDLIHRETFAKEELEAAKQAMQEWEILAMEERSIRESMQEKVADLAEQVASHREAHERAASERDIQSSTVDGLQRALQELQDARRRELREIVENSQAQVESLQKQLQEKEITASVTASQLRDAKQNLERALPFEKEVKEKNLLIGKLRHEAVILSDHLTKTLRYVKKGKPEDSIDKQIVTNHIMRFLELDRADPKKFQVLQIIAGMLSWTDEQREQAGLTRPGASNPNLRVPISPWHRAPSTPSLHADIAFDNTNRKESLAELWSDFLQQEAAEGVQSPRLADSSAPISSSAGSKPP